VDGFAGAGTAFPAKGSLSTVAVAAGCIDFVSLDFDFPQQQPPRKTDAPTIVTASRQVIDTPSAAQVDRE